MRVTARPGAAAALSALAVLLLFLPLTLAAGGAPMTGAAPAMGTVSGTVTNHTGAPRPLAGQVVRLTAYVNGAEQDWRETTADARGRFSFTVPVDPQRTYVAWLHYKDGEYTSGPVVLETPGQRATAAVKVWEPTSDAGVLQVNVHHIIIEPGEGAVRVAELLVLVNTSDRTYVGTPPSTGAGANSENPGRRSVRFSLPDGAQNVQLMDGLYERAVTVTEAEIVDSVGVKPGMREVAYSYTVPVTARALTLGRRVDYPTSRLEVFGREETGLSVTPLARQDDVRTDQGSFARYSGGPVEAGTVVAVRLSGLRGPRATARHAVLAVFVGLLAAGVIFPVLRRARPANGPRRHNLTRGELIEAVAALDDRFEAGGLPEAEYRRRRARYLDGLRA